VAPAGDAIGASGGRAFAREFFTSLGAPAASTRRLATAAKIQLLVALPLIMFPTGLAMWGWVKGAANPGAGARAVVTWWTLTAVFALASAGVLALWRREAWERLARGLACVAVLMAVATNQVSSYSAGSLTNHAPLFAVLIIAVYRIFLDYYTGLFAVVSACVLFAGCVGLELAGVLPRAPLLPHAYPHAFYGSPSATAIVVQEVIAGLLLAFFAVNYGVNQAVKLHRYITESVLRRYLPPALVARAARGELRLDAPPERRVVTVMFTDLCGFTTLSEQLGADRVAALLNRFLSRMADLAHEHGGTVDKFVGDAVMVVFGAPEPLEPAEQARRCVRLAQELQAELPGLGDGVAIQARTGINTGEAVVGNFGSLARSDYTVIGPSVNVAARLESAGQPGRILLGETTARLLDGAVPLEPERELILKGVSEPVRARFVAAPEATSRS
jgi:class 3 adenylate cyclase